MRAACLVVGLAGAVACSDTPAPPGLSFTKRVIDPAFRSEGVTVFDVDRDGNLDLVTEELWYAGPDFTPHEVRAPRMWDPLTEYASCFGAFHLEVDGDGYEDLVVLHFPGNDASWCRNPAGVDRHWDCFMIAPVVVGESPLLATSLTGMPSLAVGVGPDVVLGTVSPGADPEQPWPATALTPAGLPQAVTFGHGLGLGDLDGDGATDLITGAGWFQQPSDGSTPWTFRPVDLCPNNCTHMFVHDFNGDGAADLIGASPHNYGAWWWEQVSPGELVRHEIDTTTSQNHAAAFADLDGDGAPEFITGKRYWAHFDQDAGAYDPVVLLAYRYRRDGDTVAWDRIVIDDDSGVGSHQLEVVDVNDDGRLDIVVANKNGLFVFEHD